MSTLVESLKRLYQKGSITLEKVQQIYMKGSITRLEYDYIIGN